MGFTKETAAAFGRKGGRKTAFKHGSSYMSLIGSAGFQATCEKYFGGDSIKCQSWLANRHGAQFPNPHGNHPTLEARYRYIEAKGA